MEHAVALLEPRGSGLAARQRSSSATATAPGMIERPRAGSPSVPPVHVQAGPAGPAPLLVRLARLIVLALLSLVFRLRVEGREHLTGRQAIICANHLGWPDAFLIFALFPVEPRVYVLGERKGVVLNAFRSRVFNTLRILVPLERDQPLEATRLMLDLLARGGSLLIFPEGHLGHAEGELQPLQPGAAHLSLLSGVPLVPVGITGTSDLWLRRTLTVRIGPPLDPAALAAGPLRGRIKAMTAALAQELRALLPGDTETARWKPLRAWLTHLF